MTPHGSHCYDRDGLLICGWPEMHPPSTTVDAKSEEYIKRSERAAAEIATWPKWMQRNLKPTTVYMRPSGVETWPDYDYLDGTLSGPLTRRLADARKTRESVA